MAETVQRGIGGSQSILLVVLGREPDERGFRGACVRGGVQGWVLLLLFCSFVLFAVQRAPDLELGGNGWKRGGLGMVLQFF